VDRLVYKEIHIVGVYSQGYESYLEAFRILDENPPHLAEMHTHEFLLSDAGRALRVFGRELADPVDPICMTLHPTAATMAPAFAATAETARP
jgi:hypothetical protein